MNSMTIVGNLTKDPDLKWLDGGSAVASFSIADNGFEKGEKTTIFYDVTVWAKLAERVAEKCKKGTAVTLVGRMSPPVERGGKMYLKVTASVVEIHKAGAAPAGGQAGGELDDWSGF